MANLTATPSPIVVDNEAGETSGDAEIRYEKTRDQELWERSSNGRWTLINVHVRTGLGDEARTDGVFRITLKPGQFYELGVFDDRQGPATTHPSGRATFTLFCLLKKPEALALITDENHSFGGTWHWHHIHTSVPTSVVEIGVSRRPLVVGADGLPHLKAPDGAPTMELTPLVDDHRVELNPLLPGHHYFFVVVVADAVGNWEVRQEEFTTLRRKLTVEFPTLHVYNDGDPFSDGEGEFWFRVYAGDRTEPWVIEQFHRGTTDIGDSNQTDRPYPLGFVHAGPPEVVDERLASVSVSSWGVEHDGYLESDEGAWSLDRTLPLPAGRFVENVASRSFLLNCPVATVGDDFHYGVEVRWSVSYVP